jgi:hypothetical protein
MQAAAVIVCFILWSLLVWGFTISMLLALARAGGPTSIEAWAVLYAGGGGMAEIGENRAGLLLSARFAVRTPGGVYVLTREGRWAARALRMLRALFGVG